MPDPPTHSPLPYSMGQVHTLFDDSSLSQPQPLPMLATEGRSHVIRYVNQAFGRLIGQAPEAIVGNSLTAYLHAVSPSVREDTLTLLDLVYTTGTAEFGVDLARMVGNASVVPSSGAVWPIVDDTHRPCGLLLKASSPITELSTRQAESSTAFALRDVNERLLLAGLKAQEQAEVEIKLRDQAEAALKLRDQFISIAAHELRTPVTGIKTSAQLALRRLEDAASDADLVVQQYLLGIVGGANRLVVLMNDLMDVSRMQSENLLLLATPMDFVAFVKTLVPRYSGQGEHRQVILDTPDVCLMVTGDPGRLEQILDNLLDNAVKYSPGGGDIHVTIRRSVAGVELTVRDTGIGLPPGSEECIFEPFGRAANAQQQNLPGMGLGLHICRRIAEAHRGRMWARSKGEGEGMTIGLWLPLNDSATAES